MKTAAYLSMMAQNAWMACWAMCSEYPESVLSMLEEYRHPDGGDGLGRSARRLYRTPSSITPSKAVIWRVAISIERGHREIGVIGAA
ncbi:hypothetical protein KIF59_00900 [Enterobacter cloacae subsp. cloacae]|nr:hypothetical protein [Enterobacter cloacae subsp. cloacae]